MHDPLADLLAAVEQLANLPAHRLLNRDGEADAYGLRVPRAVYGALMDAATLVAEDFDALGEHLCEVCGEEVGTG